jgi:hypothetical protein
MSMGACEEVPPGWSKIIIGGQHGYQADNWHSSRRVSGISDWISWPLCGRHSLKADLQSLVRDDRRRASGIPDNPSLAGQSFA